MPIQPGDTLPDIELQVMGEKGPEKVRTSELFAGKKAVLFAVPGAFTPTCSAAHLPGFVVNADKLRAKGIDSIVCTSVNDAFVMDAWGKATGAVEGVNAIKTGKLISLSEEELISCSKNGNMGCNGGLMDNGFEWIVNNRGIDTEGEWEYVAKVEKCGFFRRHRRAVAIDGFKDVPTNDEDSLMKAVSQQPVSVAIEADHQSFQLYAGGVYSAKDCGTELDHGVLLVGYGVDPSSKKHKHFWKIKNSWGEAWGEDGYIRIAKGGNGLEGQCGVAMQPSYPTKMGTTPLGEPTLFEKGEELLDKGMDFLQKFAESNGGD